MARYCRECGGPLDIFETRLCAHCISRGLEKSEDTRVCPVCGHAWNEEEYDG